MPPINLLVRWQVHSSITTLAGSLPTVDLWSKVGTPLCRNSVGQCRPSTPSERRVGTPIWWVNADRRSLAAARGYTPGHKGHMGQCRPSTPSWRRVGTPLCWVNAGRRLHRSVEPVYRDVPGHAARRLSGRRGGTPWSTYVLAGQCWPSAPLVRRAGRPLWAHALLDVSSRAAESSQTDTRGREGIAHSIIALPLARAVP